MENSFTERRQNVTQRECDKTHEPINDFIKESKETFESLHEKMNSNKNLLIGALVGILVELVMTFFKKG